MAYRFGPSRGELWFRLVVSLAGLGLMVFALLFRGIGGIASAEVVLIAGGFFGGTALWTARRLWSKEGKQDGV